MTDPGLSGAQVRVDGRPLDPQIGERLLEARVQENLRLPDACLLRFSDPGLENVDTLPLQIGSQIELLLGSVDASSLSSVFKGMVVSLEPEFGKGGTILGVRAYDGSHVLHQTKVAQTFQNMTAADIARKIAQKEGIDEGTIEDTGSPYPFVQQNNETDWEFLWRLAGRIDFEVLVIDHKLHFRKAGPAPDSPPLTLRWGDDLINFKPRVTAVQQVDQVTVRARNPAQQRFEATEQVGEPASQIGISRAAASAGVKGGTMVVADRPVLSQEEAEGLAKSYAAHLGSAYLEAEGTCKGNPHIKAGSRLTIEGIGTRFGGTYVVSACTHLFQGTHGYRTHFSTSGRSSRSLVDLMTPKGTRAWGNSVVIGIVTNTNDPDQLGRVRVSYPALGDGTEGWWARITSPSAGNGRGLLMMPQVGDEVVVGFEHNDVQNPYVLGSVWNGTAKPGTDLVLTDGSFSLRSDQRVKIHAHDAITIKSETDLTLQMSGTISETASGKMSLEGSDVSIKANGGLTIEGTTDLSISCGAAKIDLSPTGTITISGSQISLGG